RDLRALRLALREGRLVARPEGRHRRARRWDRLLTMAWDPAQYHKFQAQRSMPFDDLLAMVKVRPGLRAVDLGCGTGELTRRLADALPSGEVLGLDSSAEMLARAGK